MKKYNFDVEPFSRVFLENWKLSMNERVALGMMEIAKFCAIEIPEGSMLPTLSFFPENGAVGYTFGNGIIADKGRFDALIQQNPQIKDDLLDIQKQMNRFSTYEIWQQSCAPRDLELVQHMACWGGGWGGHGNPDYDRFLHLGVSGIYQLIEDGKKRNPEKSSFYHACQIAMNALCLAGSRIADKAERLSSREPDKDKKREYQRIAETFRRIPLEPAYDFYSAVMMFWMFFTFDGIDSPGRFDQFMIDYYRIGSIQENNQILERFLEGIHEVRGWNLCISGSDENGCDETNELSYAILEKVAQMGYQTPNLTMRVHRGTPERLWALAADSLATGIGLPAIYNDEVVCPALESIGIPPCDSHDYCMNGCNQIDIMGKSHMGLEDGEVNFGKALEYTLHNGYDFQSGGTELLSNQYGDPCACQSFREFLQLFFCQLDHLTDVSIRLSNISQEVYARYAPNPMRSCLIQGCLEKGKDYKWGGPLYNHGQILAEGIADTADSIFAVKKMVFDEKKYSMEELILALENNFSGAEQLRRDFSECSKFGNDDPEVDELSAEIVDHFFQYLKRKSTFRGGVFTGGCSPYNRAANNGAWTGALPNGRFSGSSIYADSIAATPGCDRNGPTASIKSMLHYKQKEAGSGFVAQLKFQKSLFNTERGKDAFIQLAKVYFENGGQQLSVNVLDREALLCAQREPEKYRGLIVRVGGYSEYFCNLSPDLQQNIIDRSEFLI